MSTPSTGTDFYDVLGLQPGASREEIEAAYEQQRLTLGAESMALYSMTDDLDVDTERERLDEAFTVLSDPTRRMAYDESRGLASHGYPDVYLPAAEDRSDSTLGSVQAPSASSSESKPATEPDALSSEASVNSQPASSENGSSEPAAAEGPLTAAEGPQSSAPDTEPQLLVTPETEEVSVAAPAMAPTSVAQESPAAEPLPSTEEVAAAKVAVPPPPAMAPTASEPVADRALRATLELPDLDGHEISGSTLKRYRESADATIEELAKITKISKRYLRALEDNDFETLPAPVYVRGFVREYARVLKLDPTTVVKGYMKVFERYRTGGA